MLNIKWLTQRKASIYTCVEWIGMWLNVWSILEKASRGIDSVLYILRL